MNSNLGSASGVACPHCGKPVEQRVERSQGDVEWCARALLEEIESQIGPGSVRDRARMLRAALAGAPSEERIPGRFRDEPIYNPEDPGDEREREDQRKRLERLHPVEPPGERSPLIERSREWWVARAAAEGDSAVGAGVGLWGDEFVDAVRKLTFQARTSGGTAGRDEGLCAALDAVEALLPPLASTSAVSRPSECQWRESRKSCACGRPTPCEPSPEREQ